MALENRNTGTTNRTDAALASHILVMGKAQRDAPPPVQIHGTLRNVSVP